MWFGSLVVHSVVHSLVHNVANSVAHIVTHSMSLAACSSACQSITAAPDAAAKSISKITSRKITYDPVESTQPSPYNRIRKTDSYTSRQKSPDLRLPLQPAKQTLLAVLTSSPPVSGSPLPPGDGCLRSLTKYLRDLFTEFFVPFLAF